MRLRILSSDGNSRNTCSLPAAGGLGDTAHHTHVSEVANAWHREMPMANQGPENRDRVQRPGRWQLLAHGRWESGGHVVNQLFAEEARVHRSHAAQCQDERPGGWLALPSAPRGLRKHRPPIPTLGRTRSRETLALGVHLVPGASLLGGPPSRQAQEACVMREDVHVHL